MKAVDFRHTLMMEDGETAFAVIVRGDTYTMHRLKAGESVSEGECLHLGTCRSGAVAARFFTAKYGAGCNDG
jgi:hypothetical protein